MIQNLSLAILATLIIVAVSSSFFSKKGGLLNGKSNAEKDAIFSALNKLFTNDHEYFQEVYWGLNSQERVEFQLWLESDNKSKKETLKKIKDL